MLVNDANYGHPPKKVWVILYQEKHHMFDLFPSNPPYMLGFFK